MPNLIKKVLANVAGNLPTDTSGNITIGAEIERIL